MNDGGETSIGFPRRGIGKALERALAALRTAAGRFHATGATSTRV